MLTDTSMTSEPVSLETATTREVAKENRRTVEVLERTTQVLRSLSAVGARQQPSLTEALRELTEGACWALGVSFASVWMLSEDKARLRCVERLDKAGNRHLGIPDLPLAGDGPLIAAMQESRSIDAPMAQTDSRLAELLTGFLLPMNIRSLMLAPARLGGKIVGVVCLENCGDRLWMRDEEVFACSLADFFSLAMEAAERRRAEMDLKQSLSILHATLESTGDGLLVVDKAGQVVGFNGQLLKVWRMEDPGTASPDAILHQLLARMESTEGFLHRVQSLHEVPEKNSFDVVPLKDGRVLEVSSQPQIMEGAIAGRVWNFRDATERLRVESERHSLQAQLLQAQKLEALGTLAGGISHDFNNVLMSILGHAELAASSLPPDHSARADLQEIVHAGQRATDLIRRILAFSRKSPGESDCALVPVIPLVREVMQLLRSTLPAGIEIIADLTHKPLGVRIEPSQLHQVLMNLCTNAAQAMKGSGGQLLVRVVEEYIGEEAVSAFPGLKPGRTVHVSVADTGCGMDAATLGRVFEPFFTTKKDGDGSGLGLSVVHGIIRSHQGAITVESTLGRGATFHVYLPSVITAVPAAAEAPSPLKVERGGQGERIVLIEDEPAVAEFARRGLTAKGYQVVVFNQPDEAMEILRLPSNGAVDMVITDFNMPRRSGLEVAAELRQISPSLPVLLMTGNDEGLTCEAERWGVRRILTKPLSVADLATAIRQVLDESAPVLPA